MRLVFRMNLFKDFSFCVIFMGNKNGSNLKRTVGIPIVDRPINSLQCIATCPIMLLDLAKPMHGNDI